MGKIDHPLLTRLYQFDADAAARYPAAFDNGIGQLGLLLHKVLRREAYWCTPKNSLAFASTGGDGVHFSFITEHDVVTEESPVVVTVPANSGLPQDSNFIVGSNLREFLQFGFHRGYFALEQLAYDLEHTLEVYGSSEWQPTEQRHHSVGYVLGENALRIRDLLVLNFDLTPLSYSVAEFERLQATYKSLLVYPTEDEY